MNDTKTISVGITTRAITSGANGYPSITGYRAEIWARGTSGTLYTSTKKATPDEANALAHKWLARHPEYTFSIVFPSAFSVWP